MKVRITKIEECLGGISICVQYPEPENNLRFATGIEGSEYIEALNEFDRSIRKLHINDVMELTCADENGV